MFYFNYYSEINVEKPIFSYKSQLFSKKSGFCFVKE